MSTRFQHTNSYAASPAAVHAMLTSAEFRDRVCVHQKALGYSVAIDADGDAATSVVVTQTQPMEGAPAAARKLVGSSVQIVQRELWRTGDGPPSADFSVEIPGKPGQLNGSISLTDKGDGTCDEEFTGEVKVNVPLVGGKLEGFIADILTRALRREGEVGVQWLAERSG